jgi:hypothetical protein
MLKHDIGINAGVIWNLLQEVGDLSIWEIEEYTHFHESLIFYSLGWLAREGKIRFFKRDDGMHVELSSNFAEMYF